MSDKEKHKKPVYPGNTIMVRPDGPLICLAEKNITLLNSDAEVILKEKEFVLCRCGLSDKKPFCDGTHKIKKVKASAEFTDEKREGISKDKKDEEAELLITVKANAMYILKGPVTIFSRSGTSVTTRLKGALCRCGHSENKPFCDAAHKKCGFTAV